MKKSLFLLSFIFLLFPSFVFAKEYYVQELCLDSYDLIILEPGDIINFPETDNSLVKRSYLIQYDGEIISDYLSAGDDPFVVDFKGFLFGHLEVGFTDEHGFIIHIIVVPYFDDYHLIELDLSKKIPAEIYQTGDIIRVDFSGYFYNSDGEQIHNYDGYSFYTRPQKDGKNQFFSVEVAEDLLYSEYN